MTSASQVIWIVEPKEEFDGLQQTSTKSRVFSGDIHGQTTTKVKLRLPLMLLKSYWDRHEISVDDYKHIMSIVPAGFQWLHALLLGVDTSSSSLKPSFNSPCDVLISSKAIATRKVLRRLKHEFAEKDVIDASSHNLQHVPGFPRHFVPRGFFDEVANLVTPALSLFKIIEVSGIFKFKHVTFIACSFQNNCIYCVRVVPYETFMASGKYINIGYATLPYIVMDAVSKQKYCTTEESILLAST